MAVQGIIQGYANPADTSQHVLLVGRGNVYSLIENGRYAWPAQADLVAARRIFEARARKQVKGDWKRIDQIATDAMGRTAIRGLGSDGPVELLRPVSPKPWLNKAQMVFLDTYETGEFAQLTDIEDEAEFRAAVADCGDGLVRFAITELADSEDCTDLATAVSRMRTVQRQIDDVVAALESTEEAQWDGKVFVCVTGEPEDKDDEDVPGVYQLSIDGTEGIDVTMAGDQTAIAKAALDEFHSKICISTLDSFAIVVALRDGTVVAEDETPSALTLKVSFEGVLEPDDVPPAVLDGYIKAFNDCASSAERGG